MPRQEGQFLYLTARAIGARTVVEFGTSFGISTVYLGSAVVDNAGSPEASGIHDPAESR